MIERVVPPAAPLRGTIRVPGDKSLSHRAIIFASIAEGTSRLSGVLDSEDVRATLTACESLCARIEIVDSSGERGLELAVTGWGNVGPREPEHPIDCGNSGTTARLLMGVLTGWPIAVTLKGDASLSRRPMLRVIEPLSRMGAKFEAQEGHTLPVTVLGAATPKPLAYASPVASAQVKTSILLAGLRASGVTRVTEPALSRDHTERLLPAFGVSITTDPAPGVSVNGPASLVSCDLEIPGDPSSAAFPIVAAILIPGSDVSVEGVSLNPTRTGYLSALERMGARISVERSGFQGAEPVGQVRATFSEDLVATIVQSGEVPTLIDEIPILALAACRAKGTTRFDGVSELRVKESDRLSAVVDGLRAFGATVRAGEDWLEIDGPVTLNGAAVDSLGDHRLAMTWAVAGLIARGETLVERFEAVAVSYPRFAADIASLSATPDVSRGLDS